VKSIRTLGTLLIAANALRSFSLGTESDREPPLDHHPLEDTRVAKSRKKRGPAVPWDLEEKRWAHHPFPGIVPKIACRDLEKGDRGALIVLLATHAGTKHSTYNV
jgi:hypothetical protein